MIEWTVYGKIKSITRAIGSPKPNLEFTYAPDGHRATKKVTEAGGNITITYYICDAQGNQMATYILSTENTLTWQSSPIYGSSRVGTYEPAKVLNTNSDVNASVHICKWLQTQPQGYIEYNAYRGERRYELSNHLGNVLVVIRDKRSAVCVGGNIDHYEADVIQATDYYCFGSPITGRVFSALSTGKYRYGFQGQEKDDEINGYGNSISYEYRIHNSRLGRFLSIDPKFKEYPYYSPYAFSGNRVIDAIELEGLQPGLLFNSPEKAAEDFGKLFNDNSIRDNREYYTEIYKVDDKYTYAIPIKGQEHGVSNVDDIKLPEGKNSESWAHTHGKESGPEWDDEVFSEEDGDKGYSDAINKDGYVITHGGKFQKYDVETKLVTNIPVAGAMPKDDGTGNSNKTTSIYTIVKGDTLYSLSKRYKTTIDAIKTENKLKSDLIVVGQKLEITN